jgi:hypothetical protein
MLAWESVVEAKALRARGWSISAIARHLQINRRTVRRYLSDEATVGVRRPAGPDGLEPFAGYVRQRLVDDPHLWASALHDELVELGYRGSYPSLTRALRARKLRPHCEPCATVKGRDVAIISHPAGEETLCGTPHKVSYEACGNMRRWSRVCLCGGGLALSRVGIFRGFRGTRGANRGAGSGRPGCLAGRSGPGLSP